MGAVRIIRHPVTVTNAMGMVRIMRHPITVINAMIVARIKRYLQGVRVLEACLGQRVPEGLFFLCGAALQHLRGGAVISAPPCTFPW
jgi:hypothetical protein